MLDTLELQKILTKVTYRPEWHLSIDEPDTIQGPILHVIASVPNSYQNRASEPTVELRIHSQIPPVKFHQDFLIWLLWRLTRIEIHETMEWFKVDGQPFIDPHSPM